MSQENVQQFYEMIQNNEQMQQQLGAIEDRETFLNRVVQLGQENGSTFTSQEVEAFLKQKGQEQSSELSDRELESVAGGQATGFTFCVTKSKCWGSVC